MARCGLLRLEEVEVPSRVRDDVVNLPNRKVRRSRSGKVIRLGLVYIMMRLSDSRTLIVAVS